MDVNANIILEKIKGMPKKKIRGIAANKSITHGDAEMCIEEFHDAIKYIEDRGLVDLKPKFKNGKIIMAYILDK